MEKKNKITTHLDEMIDLINGFYDDEHISESGTIYRIGDKPNMNRVRLLLENLMFNNGDTLSINDQKFLMDVFSSDLKIYTDEYFRLYAEINNPDKKRSFVMDVFDKIQFKLRAQYEKNNIIFTIKQAIKDNHNQSLSPMAIKKALENKFAGKMIVSSQNEETIYALIKSNDYQYYRVDVKSNAIIYTCGKTLEKAYTFNGNKIFIFEQYAIKSKEQIKTIIEQFLLVSNDGTFGAFLDYLKKQFDVDLKSYIKKDKKNQEISMADIYQGGGEILSSKIQQLVNYGRLITKGKTIFLLNTEGNIERLGTWKTIEKPTLIPNGYKGIPGIQFSVSDKDDKKYVLISNGQQNDNFETEE